MKTLNTLGANIELKEVATGLDKGKVRYWCDVTYKGQKGEGFITISPNVSDEHLGLRAIEAAGFMDDKIFQATMNLFKKALANMENPDKAVTELMFSL